MGGPSSQRKRNRRGHRDARTRPRGAGLGGLAELQPQAARPCRRRCPRGEAPGASCLLSARPGDFAFLLTPEEKTEVVTNRDCLRRSATLSGSLPTSCSASRKKSGTVSSL